MRLTRREQLAATAQQVYAVLTDAGFQHAKCEATTAGGRYEVEVSEHALGHRVRTARELPADGLPDVARSFVGDTLTVVEVYDWGAPEPGGARQASVDLHVQGAPLTLKGTLRLEGDGAGSLELLDAELKATVPLVGGRIERAAAGPIDAAIGRELDLLRERLGG
ncbi:DUF2505 domain-containing protein [Phycicoccus endophyticus]|uniref:DUF2505 domain-containing protein n=1 Tax=Phycicoccus endophyticus TaxID=1690220 RepID=A0A7G9R372_9MICO|nr:DUF2505 domain-containing protein [Phycicoccus endophyticus]NHI19786.1 DUF2505 domain-containing protein [Phycicoccus endophyticus]QNN50047.1 DUF2505 domain-containing protein [Phycicoccus endophyticus]GGL28593.1 hypothetical protein GCM10012283_08520 [Phycicoccus endophyticus]